MTAKGNPFVNAVCSYLREKLGVTPDGTVTSNRRYAWLLLKKLTKDYPGRDDYEQLAQVLIDAALADRYHGPKFTSIAYLYYRTAAILGIVKDRIKADPNASMANIERRFDNEPGEPGDNAP